MEKRIFEAFNEIYEANLSHDVSRETSFEKAKEQFSKDYNGLSGFKSYDSFRTTRYKKRKLKGDL